jgi:hypothetical protein
MIKFVEFSKEMYAYGIKQKDVRDKEVNEFWKCINDVKESNTQDATRMINEFMETKRRVTFFQKVILFPNLSFFRSQRN